MALAMTPGYAFSTTEQVTAAKLALLVSAATGSGIDQTNFASGSGVVITSSSSPSNTNALWIDSGNSNTPKYYNGSAWTPIAGSGVPTDYRSEMLVAQASTTTMTVGVGRLEVNSLRISKTSVTTLTLSTAGDWAGGVSLRATSTYGYVGVDASGNIKMHTTAPTHSDYAVSITAGTKRYATWSSTVYRIIGWFYMNATGSGELNTYEVSNLKDGNVHNSVQLQGTDAQTLNQTNLTTVTNSTIHYYSSGRPVKGVAQLASTAAGATNGITGITLEQNVAGSGVAASDGIAGGAASGYSQQVVSNYRHTPTQGTNTFLLQYKMDGTSSMAKGNCVYQLAEE